MPRARFELSLQTGDAIDVYGDAVQSSPSFRQLFTEYNKYLLRRAAVVVGIDERCPFGPVRFLLLSRHRAGRAARLSRRR